MNSGSMPGYDLINVVEVTDRTVAAREREAAERVVRYPQLLGAGPAHFWLAEYDGRWRIRGNAELDPWDVRTSLASRLRFASEEVTGDDERAEMLDLASRLDPEQYEVTKPEAGNEWVVTGKRYRVIRGHEFVRWGDDGPEPSRATDADPGGGHAEEAYVFDPAAPTTPTDAALRLDLVNLVPDPQWVSPETAADARAALTAYPGVVLLPVCHRAMEVDDAGRWTPIGQGSPGPGQARETLADYFRLMLPRFPPEDWTPGDVEEAVKAAEHLAGDPATDFVVAGRHFRIVRGIRMIRVGRDGPEPARPSDERLYPEWLADTA
ncbi:DUF5954 family protein [Sphaerisporangium fuscum]|uniref:DUF5954 family protein n=1 Tax=Sphaerisporangium fuscum TaxID=2835868 RepID=UPI001BDDADD5|nr:DUF5954 family protein [Sphaerisporangium fuscum]